MSIQISDLVTTPFHELEGLIDTISLEERNRLSEELANLAGNLAFLSTYISNKTDEKHNKEEHKKAVKEANLTRRRVRKIMGYHISIDINV